jgi:hypothetical protein
VTTCKCCAWGRYAPSGERTMMNTEVLLQLHFIFVTIPPEYKEHLSEACAALQHEAMQPVQPTNSCFYTHHAPIVAVLARC